MQLSCCNSFIVLVTHFKFYACLGCSMFEVEGKWMPTVLITTGVVILFEISSHMTKILQSNCQNDPLQKQACNFFSLFQVILLDEHVLVLQEALVKRYRHIGIYPKVQTYNSGKKTTCIIYPDQDNLRRDHHSCFPFCQS